MLSKEQARALVVAELARPLKYRYADDPPEFVVMDENTIEKEWGWVFFYNSMLPEDRGNQSCPCWERTVHRKSPHRRNTRNGHRVAHRALHRRI